MDMKQCLEIFYSSSNKDFQRGGGGGPCCVKQRVLTSFNQLNIEGRFLKKKGSQWGEGG